MVPWNPKHNKPYMSRVCELTGRGTQTGNKRSHALNATRRTFKVNLQTKRINGIKVRLSTKAIKTLKRAMKNAS